MLLIEKCQNKWIDYEIENIENKGSTIAYFNELFAFEGKLEANNEISFIIKYNPISQMTEDEWDTESIEYQIYK